MASVKLPCGHEGIQFGLSAQCFECRHAGKEFEYEWRPRKLLWTKSGWYLKVKPRPKSNETQKQPSTP